MADRVVSDEKRAGELQGWLESLGLESRVINPLRRELEVVQGKRESVPGKSGVLTGVDQARFVAELYSNRGGVIRRVPAVGTSAIDALRAVIPAPASTNGAPVYGDDFELPPLDDELPAHAAEAGPEALPPVAAEEPVAPARRRRRHPQGEAAPTAEAAAPATSEAPRRRGRPRRSEDAPAAEAPPEAAPAAPKRRGRPRRGEAASAAEAAPEAPGEALATSQPPLEAVPHPAEIPATPVAPLSELPEPPSVTPRRRGRRRQSDVAQEPAQALAQEPAHAPAKGEPARRVVRQPKATPATPAPAPVEARLPVAPPVAAPVKAPPARLAAEVDGPTTQLLQLWRELHPQGRRAAMRYMAGLLNNA